VIYVLKALLLVYKKQETPEMIDNGYLNYI